MVFKIMDPKTAAEQAVAAIGSGYDMTNDIRLSGCRQSGSSLIELDHTRLRHVAVPGGGDVVLSDVSASIKCDKGERTRFSSDVLSFHQMSELVNQELSLSGKIPSGLFNGMFSYRGCWQKDASTTKSVAFDGWFISLYNIELARSQIILAEYVKNDVPATWDPAALAEFIEKYGTHVVVGVKMGGKDVIHIKQLQNSTLESTQVQILLKQLADEKFSEDLNVNLSSDTDKVSGKEKGNHSVNWDPHTPILNSIVPSVVSHSKNDDLLSIHIRRGGIDKGQSHSEWLSSISQSPNAISMSFVPIASLLNGIRGSGFLGHAINLYLRYKPPIEDLHQFLEYQLPRQWAPVYGDLPLAPRYKRQVSPSLKFSIMGPKLYINTTKVDSGNRPVTGIRLYLEGKKSDHLAVHLQHLSTPPQSLQLSDDPTYDPSKDPIDRAYFEPVKWSTFSHVYTAPVQYNGARFDDSAAIVTKAWFEVKIVGMKKALFLRLGFSTVASGRVRRAEWDGPTTSSRKSGFMSTLISATFMTSVGPTEKPTKIDLNSAVYPNGPPVPKKALKLTSFVDTCEMVRGPEDPPGYWVVTGAKLCVEGGRISIKAKYSLLTIILEDSFV